MFDITSNSMFPRRVVSPMSVRLVAAMSNRQKGSLPQMALASCSSSELLKTGSNSG